MALSKAMLRPTNPVLTEAVRRRGPGKMVADIVFPPLVKPFQSTGQILVADDSHLQIVTDALRAIGAESSIAVSPDLSYLSYTTYRYARKVSVKNTELQEFANSSGGDPDILRNMLLQKPADQLKLLKEYLLAVKLNTTANYDSGLSTTLTTTWANNSGDPQGDIMTAIKALMSAGIDCTRLAAVADQQVWLELMHHSAIREYCRYTTPGPVSQEDFSKFFNITPVVASAVYVSGTTNYPVWQDGFVIYAPSAGDPFGDYGSMAFGRTIYSEETSVTSWDDPAIDHYGGEWQEVQEAYSHQFIGVDNTTDGDSAAGYLIDNAI